MFEIVLEEKKKIKREEVKGEQNSFSKNKY